MRPVSLFRISLKKSQFSIILSAIAFSGANIDRRESLCQYGNKASLLKFEELLTGKQISSEKGNIGFDRQFTNCNSSKPYLRLSTHYKMFRKQPEDRPTCVG
ncbi:hypothetical cytosolic protein [Syntrophus aciditrophicus SB]|uniref:Hypothetical cytosolic protein n=1 Tax=Syntrophus aciditrophicus (strain SB) TaxID=56780 RepID=Q2LT75_SYNAS|nr:hypothetical cytosolic protein [Syntrophus aciditrophicus SB]